ncbi:MAG: nicotinate-nucleotide adenylyltransferase [Gammaproteobacteria bacterium]
MKPVAIFGGTFNPVHNGHLRAAIEIKETLDLSAVRMIPLFAPPHRDPPEVNADLRLAMLEAATEDNADLIADDREIRRGGISYTAETLRELRSELDSDPLCMILGTDAFAHLHTWRDWQELIELAHIIVVHRPGSDLPKNVPANDLLEKLHTDKIKDLHGSPSGSFMSISIPMLEISSTQIRSILHNNRNPRYLLPESVRKIIMEKKLYK